MDMNTASKMLHIYIPWLFQGMLLTSCAGKGGILNVMIRNQQVIIQHFLPTFFVRVMLEWIWNSINTSLHKSLNKFIRIGNSRILKRLCFPSPKTVTHIRRFILQFKDFISYWWPTIALRLVVFLSHSRVQCTMYMTNYFKEHHTLGMRMETPPLHQRKCSVCHQWLMKSSDQTGEWNILQE